MPKWHEVELILPMPNFSQVEFFFRINENKKSYILCIRASKMLAYKPHS